MLTYPHIDPIAFRLGPVSFHWYGLMYVFGIGIAWILAVWRGRTQVRYRYFTAEVVSDLIVYLMFGVIIGGRLGYLLFYRRLK